MTIFEGPDLDSQLYKYSFEDLPTRPSIRFEESDRPETATTSKLCGTPYLPAYAPYPERDGKPMLFLAQFNFAECPTLPGFPETGLLQLFLPNETAWGMVFNEEEKQQWDRVPTQFARYLTDLSAPHVGRVPQEAVSPTDLWTTHPAIDPLTATTIDGVRTEQVASSCSKELRAYAFTPFASRALLRRGDDYVDVHTDLGVVVTRRVIGGVTTVADTYPPVRGKEEFKAVFDAAVARVEADGFVVDPSAQEQVEAAIATSSSFTRLGGFPDYDNDDVLFPGDPRVLLALVNNNANLTLGDLGHANFYIHPDDLAARNFDRVVFGYDCG